MTTKKNLGMSINNLTSDKILEDFLSYSELKKKISLYIWSEEDLVLQVFLVRLCSHNKCSK